MSTVLPPWREFGPILVDVTRLRVPALLLPYLPPTDDAPDVLLRRYARVLAHLCGHRHAWPALAAAKLQPGGENGQAWAEAVLRIAEVGRCQLCEQGFLCSALYQDWCCISHRRRYYREHPGESVCCMGCGRHLAERRTPGSTFCSLYCARRWRGHLPGEHAVLLSR